MCAQESGDLAERQAESERLAEAKLDARFNQKLRSEEVAGKPVRLSFGAGGYALRAAVIDGTVTASELAFASVAAAFCANVSVASSVDRSHTSHAHMSR